MMTREPHFTHAARAELLDQAVTADADAGLEQIIRDVFLANRMSWLMLMVVFIGGTFAAQYMAQARRSVGMQYAGLALYVLMEKTLPYGHWLSRAAGVALIAAGATLALA